MDSSRFMLVTGKVLRDLANHWLSAAVIRLPLNASERAGEHLRNRREPCCFGMS